MMRSLRFLVLFLLFALPTKLDSLAQSGEGVLHLTDWPEALLTEGRQLEPFADLDVLPFLDSLTLEYRYEVVDEQPTLSFVLAWVPGTEGILEGERVPLEEMPEDLRLIALDVQADVVVGGERKTDLIISVDSLALSPVPYVYPFEAAGLSWETLFEDLDPAETQRFFEEGFELRNLRVLRIAFAVYEDEVREVVVAPRPRRPSRTTIYIPDRTIWVVIGRDPYRPPPSIDDRPNRPRRDTMGRARLGSSGRAKDRGSSRGGDTTRGERRSDDNEDSADSDGKRGSILDKIVGDDDDDEEDDDEQLLPAAIAGVAAVGIIAFAGGTIGYYGHAEAPIGLMSGFVRPGWGMVLEVAVNDAVLGAKGEPERLIATLTGFYDVFNTSVQPALGFGVWAEEDGDDILLSPTVSVGAVGVFGPVVLQGGYDLTEGGIQFGVAYNFRHR